MHCTSLIPSWVILPGWIMLLIMIYKNQVSFENKGD